MTRNDASRVDPVPAVDKARSADFSVDPSAVSTDTARTCATPVPPASDAPAPPRCQMLIFTNETMPTLCSAPLPCATHPCSHVGTVQGDTGIDVDGNRVSGGFCTRCGHGVGEDSGLRCPPQGGVA